MSDESLTYRDAGVDIDAGNALVERIKPLVKRTHRAEVMSGLGGFGGLCSIPSKYKEPVLVSGTDGVGTKLRLAIDTGIHNTVGIDLVAMCVNDLIVQGAEPLFFLDYFATAKLDVDAAASVIEGIAKGCELAGCALIGGETAEMPGMYQANDYDLAGFCVGVAEKSRIIDGSQVKPGQSILALPSSGPHANGFSLIRKIIERTGADFTTVVANKTLGQHLLEPTKIYVKAILALMQSVDIKAISHITGGGLLENIPRVLPNHTAATIDTQTWKMPEIFQWLQQQGNIDNNEMYRTFNCGIGMVLCVDQDDVDRAIAQLESLGEQAFCIGTIKSTEEKSPAVIIQG